VSRWRFAGLVGVPVALLAGCATEQPAQDLSTSLPVAALLVVVPAVLGVVAIRGVLRWARRWPPVEGLDGRQGVVIAPLAGAVALVLSAWVLTVSQVAVGYREVHDDIYSWEEMRGMARWVAGGGLVVVVLAYGLGLGVWRGRMGAAVALVLLTVAALVAQARMILGTDESLSAWVVAAIEATYLLVVGSLIVDPPRPGRPDG